MTIAILKIHAYLFLILFELYALFLELLLQAFKDNLAYYQTFLLINVGGKRADDPLDGR